MADIELRIAAEQEKKDGKNGEKKKEEEDSNKKGCLFFLLCCCCCDLFKALCQCCNACCGKCGKCGKCCCSMIGSCGKCCGITIKKCLAIFCLCFGFCGCAGECGLVCHGCLFHCIKNKSFRTYILHVIVIIIWSIFAIFSYIIDDIESDDTCWLLLAVGMTLILIGCLFTMIVKCCYVNGVPHVNNNSGDSGIGGDSGRKLSKNPCTLIIGILFSIGGLLWLFGFWCIGCPYGNDACYTYRCLEYYAEPTLIMLLCLTFAAYNLCKFLLYINVSYRINALATSILIFSLMICLSLYQFISDLNFSEYALLVGSTFISFSLFLFFVFKGFFLQKMGRIILGSIIIVSSLIIVIGFVSDTSNADVFDTLKSFTVGIIALFAAILLGQDLILIESKVEVERHLSSISQ